MAIRKTVYVLNPITLEELDVIYYFDKPNGHYYIGKVFSDGLFSDRCVPLFADWKRV